ncbi:MAG: D-alanyl-D-alanine carboxypeptidase, partial [Brachymonas sp.]|nr:D-alanyl-D-alanine carboxypeptidase [Brachymonas sp.]
MSFSRLSRFSFFRSRQLAAACALCITLASALPAPVGAQPTSASQPAAAASASATAAPATSATAPAQAGFPAPPAVAARSFLLIDISANNQILAAKDIDAVMEPASLTKLMTAYVVFDALKSGKISLEQTFGVSERAWKMPGSRMFIRPNTQVPVEDLLKGMIVQSGNDASVALAEGLLGSQEAFVEQMNATAKKLGMHNTGYRNPEGLTTEGHTTTARDMALLSTRLLADFPQYTGYYAIKSYHYPGTPETNGNNRNLLLFRDPSVDGLKTGHTAAAGYNLIATANRPSPASPQGRRLLVIVMGAASEAARAEEALKLLNWGYGAFENVQLL